MKTFNIKLTLLFSCLFVEISSCNQANEKEHLNIPNNWMEKNLATTTFQNGDSIPYIRDINLWRETENSAYTFFNNDSLNAESFGLLYNWYAVSDPRGLCPKGWRVPNTKDWVELIDLFGGAEEAAKHLKSFEYWSLDGDSVIADSGFEALPGGNRRDDGVFNGIYLSATFWTIEEVENDEAVAYFMNYAHSKIGSNAGNKKNGLSCRCIKD